MGTTGEKVLIIFGVEKVIIYALKCQHSTIYSSLRC